MSAGRGEAGELLFVPLGGAGEIGMNLNVYGYGPPHARKWVILDCGVTFGDASTPGVDIITPDPQFIAERAEDLVGIVLTHAHEDHMGAVAHLWPQLRAPIYATPFTAWLVRDRLGEAGLEGEAPVHEIPLDARLTLGPFDLQLITITHSIPEPNGVVIRTPAGLVLHTGDWKIDPNPLIGRPTDIEAIQAVAEEGVTAMVCDSTNAMTPGEAGSEADVRTELVNLVGELHGKVAVAAFASNVARLETAMLAAEANDRRVCLVGRSMHRMVAAARHVGLLQGAGNFVDEEEAGYFPPDKILYLCTGSQGEPRAALSRIASGSHRHVSLGRGDTVLFSSRVIPGNEIAINTLQNQLVDRGVRLITSNDRPIHVSGHPCRDELRAMYQWARPQIAVPVHGERRHLNAHAELARSLQIPEVLAPRNGDVIRLAPGPAAVIDEAPSGRLHLDGGMLTPAEATTLRDRKRIAYNGAVTIAMTLDARGRIVAGPEARARGIPEEEDYDAQAFLTDVADEASDALAALPRGKRDEEAAIEKAVVRAVKGLATEVYHKRPLVDVIILRV